MRWGWLVVVGGLPRGQCWRPKKLEARENMNGDLPKEGLGEL